MNSKTPDQDYGHWDTDLVGEFHPEDHLGFVYQITRLDSGRSYIGCKHLWKYSKGKRKAASEWRNYVSSSNYLNPELRAKLSANARGIDNGRYHGPFTVTFKNGTAIRVEDKTLKDFCEENGLSTSSLYRVRKGQRKTHKGIIKVEYDNELKEN